MTRIFLLLISLIGALALLAYTFPQNSQFFGAFYGAFFAFLFIVIAKVFESYYNRVRTNYVGIAEVQHECVRFINMIDCNIQEINNMLSCFNLEKNEFNHYIFQPRKISVDKSILLKISKLPFLHDVMSLFLEMESLNHIMNAVKDSNDIFRDDFRKNGIIPSEAVEARIRNLKGTLLTLNEQLEKVYNLMSKARTLSDIDKSKNWLIRIDNSNEYTKDENRLFKFELQKMYLEMETHTKARSEKARFSYCES